MMMMMMIPVVLLLAVMSCVMAKPSSLAGPLQAKDPFSEFKKKYGKTYRNKTEENWRKDIFESNLDIIRNHNALYDCGEKTFYLDINQFADMTHEEYKQLLGFQPSVGKRPTGNKACPRRKARQTPPDTVDWRDSNLVTPVKNQGLCGSCWAFSITGALEGQHAKQTGNIVSLSEQHLVDCSQYDYGCNGGYLTTAFQHVIDNGGIAESSEYPYTAYPGACQSNQLVAFADLSYTTLPAGSEEALKQAVAVEGPIAAAMHANLRSFMFYSGGVYIDPRCYSTQLDHAVLVVGYGTENGKDYWLVKNSWSTNWGEKGYIKIARNINNMCGLATAAISLDGN